MIENITKLENAKIGIIGNNKITDIAVANLVGLGIQEIYVFGSPEQRLFQNDFFTKRFPKLTHYISEKEFTGNYLSGLTLDMILVTTTKQSERLASKNSPYSMLSIVCDESRGEIIKGYSEELTANTIYTGGICAALAVDEIRKKIAPESVLDTPKQEMITYTPPEMKKSLEIITVGAGGLGNYFAIAASELGHDITLFDFDTFQERNKHRQPYCIPGRNKAHVLAESFQNITPIPEKFSENKIQIIPDIIVGCVDNVSTRKEIFQFAKAHNIPYLDGGVGLNRGQVQLYKQTPKGTDKPKKEVSCALIQSPSIVIPNCIIGMQLAIAAPFAAHATEYSFSFDTLMPRRIGQYGTI